MMPLIKCSTRPKTAGSIICLLEIHVEIVDFVKIFHRIDSPEKSKKD